MESREKNLIPHFIHEQFERRNYGGRLPAAAMFVDISGFTQLMETLMRGGDEGAEILSAILNQIFNPTVNAIAAHEGFISMFAGDAFTAIFGESANERVSESALACAAKIQDIFREHGFHRTRFGEFTLGVKIGLAYGEVEWGIVGQTEKAYFFRGEPVDGCAQAEHQARQGEIIVTEKLARVSDYDGFVVATLVAHPTPTTEVVITGPQYYRLVKSPRRVALPSPTRRPRLTKEVLARFLPDAVIEFDRTGEFRNVASVFISFAGIAARAELDTFVSVLIDNAKHFSGYFNKIDFGDKGGVALCLFGAPTAFENNVERALDFILAVRRDFHSLRDFGSLKWRAGITYGAVYAGIIGGEKRCEYTAIGDAVNLAARLTMRAGWGETWVAGRVHRYAQKEYDFEPLGEFAFKGKTGQIPAYLLRAKKAMAERAFGGKFVGRETELALAGQSLRPLAEGQFGGVLYVYGEAGVGKSRFVYELRRQNPRFDWLYLPCDGILKKAFNPFAHFFTRFFNQSTENNRPNFERIYQELIDTVDRSHAEGAERIKSELVRLRSIMAGFLGIRYEGSLYEQLEPKLRYQNTLYAFRETFRALNLVRPVVLELEDVQWIDPDSVRAIQTLCQDVANLPLLLIVTGRYREDGGKPRLPLEVNAREIDLNTLSEAGVKALAEDLLAGRAAPRLLESLVAKTEGNPFFVEQTLRYYREAGIIERQPTPPVWDVVRAESAIPATINDLLIARIDRLSDTLKEVVQTAAVVGREFEVRLLAEVLRRIDEALLPEDMAIHLQEGVDRNMWAILSELTYIFSHALLQDAVYRMQLKVRLRRLHRLVAEAIERLHPEDQRAYSDLAFHYERAEIREKTIEYLHKAGDFAKETYAVEEAIGYYQKALGFLSETLEVWTQRVELYNGLGMMLRWQARYAEAVEIYTTMRAAAEVTEDAVAQACAWIELSHVQDTQGDYRAALESAGQAEEIARAAGAQVELARALVLKGWARFRLGEVETALALGEQALALSTELNARRVMGGSLNLLGGLHITLGHYDDAVRDMERVLPLFRESGDRRRVGATLNNLGEVARSRGDYRAAAALYQDALSIAREIGNRVTEIVSLSNLGGARVGLGECRAAETDLRQALRMAETAGRGGLSEMHRFLAEALLGQGKVGDALAAARQALALGQEAETQGLIGGAWRTLGMVTAQAAEPIAIGAKTYDAAACFIESLRIFTGMGVEAERARTLREWARYEVEQGDEEKGETMWQEARETFARLEMELEVERMNVLGGEEQ
ncbi:MAG: tetratricopeptide repeat protein [Chloroflexota bacterium]|nr:tetratricopeptide repeat protein [Chloroflexota bacterium]